MIFFAFNSLARITSSYTHPERSRLMRKITLACAAALFCVLVALGGCSTHSQEPNNEPEEQQVSS